MSQAIDTSVIRLISKLSSESGKRHPSGLQFQVVAADQKSISGCLSERDVGPLFPDGNLFYW